MSGNATCAGGATNENTDRLASFATNIIKSFILLTLIISIYYLKGKYLPKDGSESPLIINLIMFILLGTVMLTILGVTDMYIFNQVVLGLGIGLGIRFFE